MLKMGSVCLFVGGLPSVVWVIISVWHLKVISGFMRPWSAVWNLTMEAELSSISAPPACMFLMRTQNIFLISDKNQGECSRNPDLWTHERWISDPSGWMYHFEIGQDFVLCMNNVIFKTHIKRYFILSAPLLCPGVHLPWLWCHFIPFISKANLEIQNNYVGKHLLWFFIMEHVLSERIRGQNRE